MATWWLSIIIIVVVVVVAVVVVFVVVVVVVVTARPLTVPGIRIRREEKEREADVSFETAKS